MSPRPPLPRKVGGHDPPAPMGAPALAQATHRCTKCNSQRPVPIIVALRFQCAQGLSLTEILQIDL